MAADWIKMRRGLRHDPKVIAIARELSGRRDFMDWWGDPVRVTCHEHVTEIVTFANVTRVTVCALLDVWAALNNTLGEDGKAPFMCLQDIDDIAEIPGFGDAMESVGWVVELEDGSLVFPNFSENNSPSKTREGAPKSGAQRAKECRERKKAQREQSAPVTPSRNVTTEKRREEKRREETKRGAVPAQPTPPPAADEWSEPLDTPEPRPLVSLAAAISHGPFLQLTEEEVAHWWHVRNSAGWTRGTEGGGHARKITSWQSDLKSSTSWIRESMAKAKNQPSHRAAKAQREYPENFAPLPDA